MQQHHAKPGIRSFRDAAFLFFCGACMGIADIIPGISGGTIAFIMGIYENWINSIKSINLQAVKFFFSGRMKELRRSVAWEFLLLLLSGILFAFATLASLFQYLLGHEVYRVYLYAGFLGLILASIIFCARQVSKWQLAHCLALTFGVLVAFLLTGTTLQPLNHQGNYRVEIAKDSWIGEGTQSRQVENYDDDTGTLTGVTKATLVAMVVRGVIAPETTVYSDESQSVMKAGEIATLTWRMNIDWLLVGCGAIAVCAMLLPGISGSYLLTILGAYVVVIGALADFVKSLRQFAFDGDAFFVLFSLAIGVIAGALLFSRVVSWLFTHYHNIAIAMLTGFMVGALRSVWPFWSYTYFLLPLKLERGPQLQAAAPIFPSFSESSSWIAFLFILLGAGIVFFVEFAASRRKTPTLS